MLLHQLGALPLSQDALLQVSYHILKTTAVLFSHTVTWPLVKLFLLSCLVSQIKEKGKK